MERGDRGKTVMLLGGSGLVGHAVSRRLLSSSSGPPRRLVLVALYEEEVRAAAQALAPYRGRTTIDVEWGNVFMPTPTARPHLSGLPATPQHFQLALRCLIM